MNEKDILYYYENNKSKFFERALLHLLHIDVYHLISEDCAVLNKINQNIFDNLYNYLCSSIMIEGIDFKKSSKFTIVILNKSKFEFLTRKIIGD